MTKHRLEVGSTYENEKGPFLVLAIQGEWMLIEWDDGEQLKTKVAFPQKVQQRMEMEACQPKTGGSRNAPVWMGRSFTGLQPTDFPEDVAGTHWRSREQLGGAVARLIDASESVFDPDRRSLLRAELDACYARLYGLTCEELQYILDPATTHGPDYPTVTFPGLRKNEIAKHGEYRTQRLVLEAWDRQA
jgi:hypothetical protein